MEAFETWLTRVEDHRQTSGRPLVTLSYAQSLDGSLSIKRGQSTPLSSPESSQLTHRLRAAHDAILVGVGTVLSDNPRLTVRLVKGENPQPVILDSHLRTPLDAFLVREHPKHPWIGTALEIDRGKKALFESAGVRLLPLPTDRSGRVVPGSLLDCLAGMGVNTLMVEGGAQVITSFLLTQLVDQVFITISPTFLGGLRSIEESLALSTTGGKIEFPRLKDQSLIRAGEDIVLWGNLVHEQLI